MFDNYFSSSMLFGGIHLLLSLRQKHQNHKYFYHILSDLLTLSVFIHLQS